MKAKKKFKNMQIFSSDDYDEKYMKIKFNSDDELPVNKMMEISSMILVFKLSLTANVNNINIIKTNINKSYFSDCNGIRTHNHLVLK